MPYIAYAVKCITDEDISIQAEIMLAHYLYFPVLK